MKPSTKIILPIILISALLILINGCTGVVPADESPGFTPGTITGTIAAPCCDTSAAQVTAPSGVSPEFWCYYCVKAWYLQDGVEVVLTYDGNEVDTTTTNEIGEYIFTDVPPGKNYVVTAYCPDYDDDRPLVKDVALELTEDGSFDTKITDLVSTSLGLVVDFLLDFTILTSEDIVLDDVVADKPDFEDFPKFKNLIKEVLRVLEACNDVNTDDDLQYALCLAAEEISSLTIGCGPGYTPPPPVNPCAGNSAPNVTSVEYDSGSGFVSVAPGAEIHVQVGQIYDVRVNATDDGTRYPLTYSGTVDGVPFGPNSSNQITVTPTIVDEYLISLSVYDGCVTTTWGAVTVIVEPVTLTVNISPSEAETAGCTVARNAAGPYNYNDVVQLTPTAAAGYTFSGWTGADSADLVDVGGGDWTITMDEDKAVTATFSEDCYNLVVTIVGMGSVDKSPDETCYAYDTVVTMTPTADPGWSFDGWSGPDSGDVSANAITMDEDKAVTATFSEDCYNLVVTIVGMGSVDKSPDETCYAYDTVVTMTPTADPGWSFVGWSGVDSGDLVDNGDDTYDITMDEDKAVTATFEEAIISPEDSTGTSDPGQNRIRLTLLDQNGNRIPGDTLDLSLGMWEVFQGATERNVTVINFGTEGANWDVEIFVDVLTGGTKPTIKYYGYNPSDPVIINI